MVYVSDFGQLWGRCVLQGFIIHSLVDIGQNEMRSTTGVDGDLLKEKGDEELIIQ